MIQNVGSFRRTIGFNQPDLERVRDPKRDFALQSQQITGTVDRLVSISKSGSAGDHDQVLDPRQIGCQIFGYRFGEILLLRIGAQAGLELTRFGGRFVA